MNVIMITNLRSSIDSLISRPLIVLRSLKNRRENTQYWWLRVSDRQILVDGGDVESDQWRPNRRWTLRKTLLTRNPMTRMTDVRVRHQKKHYLWKSGTCLQFRCPKLLEFWRRTHWNSQLNQKRRKDGKFLCLESLDQVASRKKDTVPSYGVQWYTILKLKVVVDDRWKEIWVWFELRILYHIALQKARDPCKC